MGIIGINGKIGSGKDTVGLIIQYLVSCKNDKPAVGSWTINGFVNTSDWKVKKFADKLKDIICILIGCDRKQLEDREFKKKELGKEWDYYIFGKNFVSKSEIIQKYKDEWGSEPTDYWLNSQKVAMTPRKLLQLLGTECGRDIIHPNIWINALMSEYKPIGYREKVGNTNRLEVNFVHGKMVGTPTNCEPIYPNWVITDMRFPNELEAIRSRDGVTIRVNRQGYGTSMLALANDHESETALDGATFDYVIDNNSDIQSLIEKVKQILIKEGIL